MEDISTYFLDLDGTLADSRSGLFGSFRAGLAAVGAGQLSDGDLQGFLGTPLPVLFRSARPGIGKHGIQAGIAAFRDYYERQGIFENVLYPGVREMLAALRNARRSAWIVTSKPQPHAVRVAALLQIDGFLDGIIGAGLAETDTKTELVARALTNSGTRAAQSLMLGDRHYDVVGARENAVEPVGAVWGYGSKAELEEAGCRLFASSPAEFQANFIMLSSGAAAVA